jgi:hypothetical protein
MAGSVTGFSRKSACAGIASVAHSSADQTATGPPVPSPARTSCAGVGAESVGVLARPVDHCHDIVGSTGVDGIRRAFIWTTTLDVDSTICAVSAR